MSFVIDNINEKLEILTDKCAVVYEGQSFTYADLQRRYMQLLPIIQSIDINKNHATIVLLMRRSFDLLAAMIAIWESGAAYVPIDPNTPPQRIQYMLDNTTPSCIISEPAYLEKLSTETLPILTFQDVREAGSIEQSFQTIHSRLQNRLIGDQIAYVIYTSGSTGHPKGVMVSHANVSNHITWLVDKFDFSEKDIISFNSSIAFDFSVACTLLPLSIGAKIVITAEENTLNIPYYCQQLTKEKVTFVKWTPSYFKLVLNYAEHHHPDLSSLRLVMLGGEEVLTTYVNRWLSIYPNHTLINEYGPTEAAVGITTHAVTQATLDKTEATVPIGQKAINSDLYVVDKNYHPVQIGEIGELLIGGESVAKGYINNVRLTEEKFIKVPSLSTTQTLYKTGDLVKQRPDGNYVYIGRIDTQVKINGYRVEISEIEHGLLAYPGIKQVVVHPEKHPDQAMTYLTAYLLLENNCAHPNTLPLKKYLSDHIPTFMIPEKYFIVSHIPMNANRKVDYHRIKDYIIENRKQKNALEDTHDAFSIKNILKRYLSVENIDMKKTFFDLGITSLLAIQIINDINQKYQKNIAIQDLFTYSTPLALDNFIKYGNMSKNKKNRTPDDIASSTCHEPIAVIAMDCRLPMAENCEELWKLCQEANEAIQFFNQNEVDAVHDDRIYARGVLKDSDKFDAAFFNITPKEAKMMDPQHRLLLESVWTALEKAGYISGNNTPTQTGVYVSMNDSTYLMDQHIQSSPLEIGKRFALQRLISPQFLATKIAYYLNLTGPAISLQTACSSSLTAVVLACQQLSAKDCNMAIAGGISLITPQDIPYHYQPGNILSPDGHCRPFDASANGTVFSNGLGIVVLKRLADAQRDNDNIAAIIRGYAMNNDGHEKMSYAAPSLQGQLSCILSAQSIANIHPESIQYVETHGTGTLVGDPIEMAALTKAFQQRTHKQQ
ncbi:MAG: amino acid adenylation domain-containing protein [Gammaproteobacteria bacterium]|nr:amino acid adenylation domain-containing protein [Gammaproteobacteria bacterium]